jgi:hypothetical protein
MKYYSEQLERNKQDRLNIKIYLFTFTFLNAVDIVTYFIVNNKMIIDHILFFAIMIFFWYMIFISAINLFKLNKQKKKFERELILENETAEEKLYRTRKEKLKRVLS